jgi:hypothetical protein
MQLMKKMLLLHQLRVFSSWFKTLLLKELLFKLFERCNWAKRRLFGRSICKINLQDCCLVPTGVWYLGFRNMMIIESFYKFSATPPFTVQEFSGGEG